MNKGLFILLAFIAIPFVSCKEEPFDFGWVNFSVNPESTEYYNLNSGNRGWEYFEGGMRGVVVFRLNYGEYVCYERTCTAKNCHGRLEVDPSTNVILVCPECNSSFIFYDGSPTSGSEAKRNLYSYCTYFDGTDLFVNNCN
ncbi:MAG: hypothetical protein WC135_03900 [Bacteroidales bacterium]